MDPYRLPRHVVPTRYDLRLSEIRLEPNRPAGSFAGEETITLTVHHPVSKIVLNAAALQVEHAAIKNDAGISQRATVVLEEATERCRLTFSSTIPPGTWQLQLSFRGALKDELRGFYRSKYKDRSGADRMLATTQFEPTDARRAFPCWDEPAFKAVFALTLVIDPTLTAVSNAPVRSEQLEGGRKVVCFADTIPMSTYLVAFVVGELEATKPIPVGRTPLCIYRVPGQLPLAELAAFGQQIGQAALQFFEEYYGQPYPGEKLDLLAIPDFEAGAMENLGAITFRESRLLVKADEATHAELEGVADTVAHEIAHMWFGDLVTMSWWNGLWLNEAFATFMELLAVDAWRPEWRRWTTFGVSRAAALEVDGLHSTRPIEFPVDRPLDANAMFDVLTYQKGGSVLRMLEQYLDPDVFRAGVRGYLRQHAYGNAETDDLWAALGQAAGLEIPELMDGWIRRPGYPLISARLDRGRQLVLTQQRFTYLPAPLDGAGPAPGQDPRWHVPVHLRITSNGKDAVQQVLLKDAEARLELPEGFESVLVNESGHGFYRVHYETPELLESLLRLVPDKVAAIERFNLVNDAWAAALAGRIRLTEYLELTARFRVERDKNVWAILAQSFAALDRIIDPADRPALGAFVRDRVGPAVADLGWDPRLDEDELTRQLRGDLLRTLGLLGNDRAIQDRAVGIYATYLGQPAAVDAAVVTAVIAILAHAGDEARYEEFFRRYSDARDAGTPQDKERYLDALSKFQQPHLLDRTRKYTIDREVIRPQDAPAVVRSLLMSVYGREPTWEFVKNNWPTLNDLYKPSGLRLMCRGVIGLATPELERDVRQFFVERQIDLGGKILEQYFEQLDIAVKLREREGAALHDYLARSAPT